jgi:preprotein translocase subunit SecF
VARRDSELAALTERLEGLKELLLALRDEDGKARDHQFRENERRLRELNHAHEQAQEVRLTYVTLDKYDDYIKQAEAAREVALARFDEKLDALDKTVEDVSREQGAQKARAAAYTVALGVAFSLITVALRFL